MDMNQKRVIPAWVSALVAGVLGSVLVAYVGPGGDIGKSFMAFAATVALFLAPGCAGVAFSAWRAQQKQRAADHTAAMAVMETVAPLEAESLPLATVRSLTEVQVERRQRERSIAERAARQAS
jgi:hypothetical protein